MKDLLPRLISGAVFLAVMIFGIMDGRFRPILFSVIVAIGTFEVLKLVNGRGNALAWVIAGAVLAVTGLLFFNSTYFSLLTNEFGLVLITLSATLILTGLYRVFVSQLPKWMDQVLGIFMVSIPFILLFGLDKTSILIIFILIWINDSFAYVFGRWLGNRKLFPRHSPKKTWEGFFGGLFMCCVCAWGLAKIDFLGSDLLSNPLWYMSYALIIPIMGTLGDLMESSMKRSAGVKDSGNIMPGHGGILDRFDAVLLSVPLIYLTQHFIY